MSATKISKDILGYIPASLGPPVIKFLGFIIISRILGPDLFGEYILFVVTTTSLGLIFQGWLSHGVFRYYNIEFKEEGKSSFHIVYSIVIATTIIQLVILWVIFTYLGFNPIVLWCFVGAFALLSAGLFEILKSLKRAQLEVLNYNKVLFLADGLSIIFPVLYLSLFSPSVLVVVALIYLTKFVVLLYYLPYKFILFNKKLTNDFKRLFKKLFYYGFPLSVATIGHQIISISDRYFLEYFRGVETVGLYSASYELFFKVIMYAFPFIGAATTPHILKLFDDGKKSEAYQLHKETLYLLLFVLSPFIGLLTFYSNDVLYLILGDEYSKVSQAVLISILFSAFYWVITTYNYRMLMLSEKTKYNAIAAGSCALINIILNIWLIEAYGMLGAAISSISSYFLLSVITYYFALQEHKTLKPGIFQVNLFILIGLLSGTLVYYSSLWIMQFDIRELDLVFRVLTFAGLMLFTYVVNFFLIYWDKEMRFTVRKSINNISKFFL